MELFTALVVLVIGLLAAFFIVKVAVREAVNQVYDTAEKKQKMDAELAQMIELEKKKNSHHTK